MKDRWLIRSFLVMNMLLITPVNNAQNSSTTLLDELIEEISVDNDEEEKKIDWTDELEALSQRLEQPLNLNTGTKEQLERFPFLNDRQIENLLSYLYLHGSMQTIYELQLVEGMDRQTIRYLLPFVVVEPVTPNQPIPSLQQLLKYGKSEALTRLDIPFYSRAGYDTKYLGDPLYHSLRYGFRYKEQLNAGFSAEKDPGEPFASLHNKRGYDFYGFYLLLQQLGRFKKLALGNYRLGFGQGLVISTDFLMGKTAYLSDFTFRSSGIRKHVSTDEYNYFRGAAATLTLHRSWELSAFYSHRFLDGAVEDGKITSIYRTGLHRSESEVNKRETFTLQLAGGNLTYRKGRLKLGTTGIYYFLNYPYQPPLKSYNQHDIRGKSYYNLGVDYNYRWNQFSFQGEVATGTKGVASLHKFQYTPLSGTTIQLLHRYYTPNYWALFANAFGESSGVKNEKGWYIAAETTPLAHWKLFGSIDLFSFPAWKYRISKPSNGLDLMLRATYSPQKTVSMYIHYRYKRKERDVTGTKGEQTLKTFHQRLRYRLNYASIDWLSLRTTLDGNRFQLYGKVPTYGYQITQTVACQLPRFPLQITLQGSYFKTDDYDSRVYISEKGLLYTFYTPSFSGSGFRMVANLQCKINSHWMVIAKWGETRYTDREEIGSGYDLIGSNKKTDLQLQLRLKF